MGKYITLSSMMLDECSMACCVRVRSVRRWVRLGQVGSVYSAILGRLSVDYVRL
jgi:hypothetical protein